MRILITGGGGFIGFEAAMNFKRLGHDVMILDKSPDHHRWRKAKTLKIEKTYADVLDISMLSQVKKFNPEAIIHCAAQTAATTGYKDPLGDFVTNARGTFEVCEYARRNNSEIIFTSSNKVYGENVNKYAAKWNNRWGFLSTSSVEFAIDEDFPIDLTSHSPYGCSKLAADIYVQDYHHTYGVKTNVYRMSCIYGESQTGTEDQGWIYHIVNQIINEKEVKIFGDGCQVRDILHVDDLVRLMELTLKKEGSDVYNVGGGLDRTLSVLELINFVNPEYKNYTFHPWRSADQKVYISDITKVKRKLNWEPSISVEQGLTRMVNKLKVKKI